MRMEVITFVRQQGHSDASDARKGDREMVKEQKRQREIVAMRAEARQQLSNGRRLCDMSDELKIVKERV